MPISSDSEESDHGFAPGECDFLIGVENKAKSSLIGAESQSEFVSYSNSSISGKNVPMKASECFESMASSRVGRKRKPNILDDVTDDLEFEEDGQNLDDFDDLLDMLGYMVIPLRHAEVHEGEMMTSFQMFKWWNIESFKSEIMTKTMILKYSEK